VVTIFAQCHTALKKLETDLQTSKNEEIQTVYRLKGMVRWLVEHDGT